MSTVTTIYDYDERPGGLVEVTADRRIDGRKVKDVLADAHSEEFAHEIYVALRLLEAARTGALSDALRESGNHSLRYAVDDLLKEESDRYRVLSNDWGRKFRKRWGI